MFRCAGLSLRGAALLLLPDSCRRCGISSHKGTTQSPEIEDCVVHPTLVSLGGL
jgi:hypothetical protein